MKFVMTKNAANNMLKAIGGLHDRVKTLETKVGEIKALHNEHIGHHNMQSHDARIYRLEQMQTQLESGLRSDLNRAYEKLALNSAYGKATPRNVHIIFHGVMEDGITREGLKSETIRAGIDQEIAVPDGTRFIQIYFSPLGSAGIPPVGYRGPGMPPDWKRDDPE